MLGCCWWYIAAAPGSAGSARGPSRHREAPARRDRCESRPPARTLCGRENMVRRSRRCRAMCGIVRTRSEQGGACYTLTARAPPRRTRAARNAQLPPRSPAQVFVLWRYPATHWRPPPGNKPTNTARRRAVPKSQIDTRVTARPPAPTTAARVRVVSVQLLSAFSYLRREEGRKGTIIFSQVASSEGSRGGRAELTVDRT